VRLFDRPAPKMQSVSPHKGRGRNALTAAGAKVRARDSDSMRRLVQPWQARSYGYYDVIPEVKYAAQFYSRALSVLRLYAGRIDEGGDVVEIEDSNDPGVEMLERIQDPGGGRSGLLAQYGRLMFLGGEAYLLASIDKETDDEQWEMLSPDELRMSGGSYTRFRAPTLPAEQLREAPDDAYAPLDDEDSVVYRLWRRHPRYSMLADATMQGVLDVCEELVLLTQAVRSRARSRLAGPGILLVNGKVSPIPIGGDVDDANPDEDPFVRDLIEAMTSPITDEGTASAVVPLVVRVDMDDLEKAMRLIQIADPTQLYPETGLRREAVERLAIGLDMPPEVLLGLGDSNHWSAWQVDEQTWKGHLQPVAQQLVDDLTASYYRPSLREAGVTDWRERVISYDATAIVNHPDRGKDAKDLYDKRAIGKAALREATGFDDEDAPTDEELKEMIGVQVRDGSLALYGIPSVKAGGIEPVAGEIETADTQGGQAAEVEAAPPALPQETGGDRATPGEVIGGGERAALAAKIVGASDLALHRARELAGSRLRNLAKRSRDPDIRRLLEDCRSAGQLPALLGRERAAELRAPSERELVAGARELIRESLRLWRLDTELADLLGERIEQHAARTLYDEHPTPLPASFENYVNGLNGHLTPGGAVPARP
jgi:hypothetical protein